MSEAHEDLNLNNPPGALSPVVSEKQKSETIGKKVKGGFKKQVVGRIIGAVAIASTIGIPADNINRNPNDSSWINNPETAQSLSTQDLEQRAEGLYQIKIVTPEASQKVKGLSENIKPVEWSKEEIVKLTDSLDRLPSHFYLPGQNVYRLSLPQLITRPPNVSEKSREYFEKVNYEIALESLKKDLGEDFYISYKEFQQAGYIGVFERDAGKVIPVSFYLVEGLFSMDKLEQSVACNCNSGYQSNILLDSGIISEFSEEDVFWVITHELVHRISRQENLQSVQNLLEVPSDITLEEFLRPNINKLPKETYQRIKFRLEYGTKNPNEFISVASEFYIVDKTYFLKNYTPLIGQEKSEKLYDYMKDKIFRGQEYNKGNKISE